MPFVTANILQPVIDVFEQVLLFFHENVGFGWGMSIIALTVTVRAILFPLTYKQFKSMQGLQRLAPEIKALQAKYKDDKQRLNQEMMKFYQANKVNPFGSCLPLILQAPVFISLFYMLRKDLKEDICGDALRMAAHNAHTAFNSSFVQKTTCGDAPNVHGSHQAADFLFIPDLTSKASGVVLVVLIVLYIGSQLLSSVLMASATVDPNQRKLMLALPFVFTIFIINFPAGLLVYWITTNLWTVGQQQIVRRTMGDATPPPDDDGAEPSPSATPAPNGGGLLARLAAAGGGAKEPAEPAGVGAGRSAGSAGSGVGSGRKAAPPPPPRKKKKRSGRRR